MLKRTLAVAAILASALSATAFADQYDKAGFVTKVQDGRLWVFKEGSKDLADMQKDGLPEKSEMRIGAGPDGMTIKAPSDAVIQAYLDAK